MTPDALNEWRSRLAHLQVALAQASDPAQTFGLEKQIEASRCGSPSSAHRLIETYHYGRRLPDEDAERAAATWPETIPHTPDGH